MRPQHHILDILIYGKGMGMEIFFKYCSACYGYFDDKKETWVHQHQHREEQERVEEGHDFANSELKNFSSLCTCNTQKGRNKHAKQDTQVGYIFQKLWKNTLWGNTL